MRKIFTTVFLLFTFFIVQATPNKGIDKGTKDQLKTQAAEQTRQLAVKIGLNEADYVRVKNITLERLVAIKEAEALYANNTEMKRQKLKAIEETYHQQIAAALSATQHKEYIALVSAAK